MQAKAKWTLHSLIWCTLWNATLTAGAYFAARSLIQTMEPWLSALAGSSALWSEEAKLALANLQALVAAIKMYLAPAVAASGALATVGLWLSLQAGGRSLLARAEAAPPAPAPGAQEAQGTAPPASTGALPDPAAAVQMLGILQRQGRLIDFLQEDLSQYPDAQIGAAVRTIHQDCKQALAEHVHLVPVFAQEEGSRVTIARGFDATSLRLTGAVSGEPPFQGVLRHRGWRVERIELPQITSQAGAQQIVAPAEIEVGV